jgi:hypothetical protein
MLEVANVEHALFEMLSQSYSLRRFPATDPGFGKAGVGQCFVQAMFDKQTAMIVSGLPTIQN